ncbi:MAG: hypothetical protein L6416_11955 [Candidatus Omnitrophica bacterium]|nr:hypothetical protein [Candidatus Omnitrophota bacterium]
MSTRQNKNCLNCSRQKNCNNSFVSWIFFIIGLIATVAIRIVTVMMNIHPVYGKVALYIGVVGFLFFFIYKFNISRSLANIIQEDNLIGKTREEKPLSSSEYRLIADILCNIRSEKERINYFFIFAASTIALLFAVYFDFIK